MLSIEVSHALVVVIIASAALFFGLLATNISLLMIKVIEGLFEVLGLGVLVEAAGVIRCSSDDSCRGSLHLMACFHILRA